MTPIPVHLAAHDWYAPLQAYLRSIGLTPRHDPGDAAPVRADLTGADLSFENLPGANLRDAIFIGANLSAADLSGADLRGVDFGGAYLRDTQLRGADLRDADLTDTNLSGVDLSGADLRGAKGLPTKAIVPDIDAAILAAVEAEGCALQMSDWHTCETTHCRAGWAIHLAGKAGAALEQRYGANVAGALIYAASRPDMPVPDWFASDAEALADLRRCAGGAE